MARSSLIDPLDKFRWTVDVAGFSRLGFMTCSTPGHKITTKKYSEGGAHLTPRQIIEGIDYEPVKLTRGASSDTSFTKWATGPFDLVTNNAALNESSDFFGIEIPAGVQQLGLGAPALIKSSNNYPFNYRRTVKIEHINRLGTAEVVYTLYGAFVIEYKPASDFDAMADDEVSIETIVLAYESFDVRYAQLAGTLQNIITGQA